MGYCKVWFIGAAFLALLYSAPRQGRSQAREAFVDSRAAGIWRKNAIVFKRALNGRPDCSGSPTAQEGVSCTSLSPEVFRGC
jgi:hypothetical protein